MHKACANGQDDSIIFLLQHGANPNAKDLNLKTPVFLAIENGQFNAVQMLHDTKKIDYKCYDANGQTVLHYAAVTQGNAALYIRFLVKQGGLSVTNLLNKTGFTARQYAQKVDRFKYHRVVKLLRELEQEELERTVLVDKKEETTKDTKSIPEEKPINLNRALLMGPLIGMFLFLVHFSC